MITPAFPMLSEQYGSDKRTADMSAELIEKFSDELRNFYLPDSKEEDAANVFEYACLNSELLCETEWQYEQLSVLLKKVMLITS